MWHSSTGHRSKTRQPAKMDRFSLKFVFLVFAMLCNTDSVYGTNENKLEEASSLHEEKLLVKANDAPPPTNQQGKFWTSFKLLNMYFILKLF